MLIIIITGDLNMLKVLLDNGCCYCFKTEKDLLLLSVLSGNHKIVEYLLDNYNNGINNNNNNKFI